MPHCGREYIIGHSIKAHRLWIDGLVSVFPLATHMCARGDEEWRKYLLRICDGTELVCQAISPFAIRVPDKILAPREWTHAELARAMLPHLADVATKKRRAKSSIRIVGLLERTSFAHCNKRCC